MFSCCYFNNEKMLTLGLVIEKFTFPSSGSFTLTQKCCAVPVTTHLISPRGHCRWVFHLSWWVEVWVPSTMVPPPNKSDRENSEFGWSFFGMRRGYWDVSASVLSCARSLSWYLPWQFHRLNKTTPLTVNSHSSSSGLSPSSSASPSTPSTPTVSPWCSPPRRDHLC